MIPCPMDTMFSPSNYLTNLTISSNEVVLTRASRPCPYPSPLSSLLLRVRDCRGLVLAGHKEPLYLSCPVVGWGEEQKVRGKTVGSASVPFHEAVKEANCNNNPTGRIYKSKGRHGAFLSPPDARRSPEQRFFPLRVTEPWPRLPREVVESPSLERYSRPAWTRSCAACCR